MELYKKDTSQELKVGDTVEGFDGSVFKISKIVKPTSTSDRGTVEGYIYGGASGVKLHEVKYTPEQIDAVFMADL